MSEYNEDSNISATSKKNNEKSVDIFHEDKSVIEELSNLILNYNEQNENKEQNLKDLDSKNEFRSTYKKTENLTAESIKKSFDITKIKANDIQLKSNLKEEIYLNLKSKEIKDEDIYISKLKISQKN